MTEPSYRKRKRICGAGRNRMNQKHHDCRIVYPAWDSEDRFVALKEVKTLLRSRLVNVESMFEVLFRSSDGCIDFSIGDIVIQFVRGFGVWSERRDVIQMTIEIQEEDPEKVVGYEYTLDELERVRNCSGKFT